MRRAVATLVYEVGVFGSRSAVAKRTLVTGMDHEKGSKIIAAGVEARRREEDKRRKSHFGDFGSPTAALSASASVSGPAVAAAPAAAPAPTQTIEGADLSWDEFSRLQR